MPAIPPNTTLYLKNLDTKVKKQELRRQLYVLFNAYGKVIDIVATRADGMRGQAFVVFRDLQSSTAALRALDGFEFYDRPMSITYAKRKSKATIVLEKGPEALFDPTILASYQAQQTASGLGDSEMTNGEPSKPSLGKVTYSSAQTELKGRERKRAREEEANKGGRAARDDDDEEEDSEGEDMEVATDDEEEQPKKMARIEKEDDKDEGKDKGADVAKDDDDGEEMEMASSSDEGDRDGAEASFGPPEAKSGTVPNPILFLPSVAASITEEALVSFFDGQGGFKGVELHAAPPAAGTRRSSRKTNAAATGHAFVTFGSTREAGEAKEKLDGKEIGEEGATVDVLWAFRG